MPEPISALAKSVLDRVTGEHTPASVKGDDARAGHLDIHGKDGSRYAFEYIRVLWMRLDDAATLHLQLDTHSVKVKGRNLDRLYEQLMRKEVRVLRGVGLREDLGVAEETVVHSVHVLQKPGPGRGKEPGLPLPEEENNQ